MAMVCPRCATTHEQHAQCPGCGERTDSSGVQPSRSTNSAANWQHTPWGRIFIGLLLAQGLFYGLRHLITGLFLAIRTPTEPSNESAVLWTFVLLQLLQAVTLLAAGILTGSGQRHGAMLGAVVGVWNGVLAGLTPQAVGQPFSLVGLYGDPILQTALGALAGWLGGAIWKPLTPDEPIEPPLKSRKPSHRPRPPLFGGRVAPIRVSFGTALAVGGCLGATALFQLIERIGDGGQTPIGPMIDQIVTWEIKALALLAGGALAGANTNNGLKQGLWVGVATALVLAAGQPHVAAHWLAMTALLLVSSTAFCLVGGWFGTQLFPPLAPSRRRLGAETMV
jgi:hypothetical protein